MMLSLTLVALFLGASLTFLVFDTQAEPSYCSKGPFPGIDFYGDDILMVSEPNYLACQLACTQNPGCSFFTFNLIKLRCFEKYSTQTPAMSVSSEAVAGYTKRGCTEEKKSKQIVVGMSLKSNLGADLNNPVVKQQISEQVKNELSNNGNNIFSIYWKQLSNGEVFQKTAELESPEEGNCFE